MSFQLVYVSVSMFAYVTLVSVSISLSSSFLRLYITKRIFHYKLNVAICICYKFLPMRENLCVKI